MIRIGSGAGFAGDRIEPAEILVEQANLDYLVLECLAERTIALAQKRKKQHAHTGYDVLLEKRMRSLIPKISGKKVRIITNMGAANPVAGANKIIEIAKELNVSMKVAAVIGDDVLTRISTDNLAWETEKPLKEHGQIVSANAYIGVDALLEALNSDAQIIIAGRIADPSLFLAPMIHEFKWALDDHNLLAKGTVIGHLLECAGQLTGGYFADPGKKDVKDMAHLGFPFADILADGSATFSKVANTGGKITLRTAKEQLLYEVIDPNAYITPDVIADFTSVKLEELSDGQIKVDGAVGLARPQNLKVSIGYEAGYIGEGEISYAGPNASERARLAGDIIEERIGHLFGEFRVDLIGVNACHRMSFRETDSYEVRLRVAGKAKSMAEAAIIGEEVEALYTNGPAGGGGARKVVNEVIGVVSTFIDRDRVRFQTELKEYVANETL